MKIGVVGLWHLGFVLTASWLKLGHQLVGIDFNPETIAQLSKGIAPIFEPHLDEIIGEALQNQNVIFSVDPSNLRDCDYVFLSFDTPVDENVCSALTPLEEALEKMAPYLKASCTLIVSSQVPVGTSRQFEKKMQRTIPTLRVVYSPENLRLGEAIANYLNPGHIVIGADNDEAIQSAMKLYSSIPANYLTMDLPSAEMTKHAINSFLATSITFANQFADACSTAGADFKQVAHAMKQDQRIGKKAYLSAGVGFSGGTLGRDLQILSSLNQTEGSFPIFEEIWRYNKQRPQIIVNKLCKILGDLNNKTISLLGMTYKPGTSTLRRSIPLEIARTLVKKGMIVKAYDPKANWKEADIEGIEIFSDPYLLAKESQFLLLLTEWPEFKELDYRKLSESMTEKRLFDPNQFLKDQYSNFREFGYNIFTTNNLTKK
jgi:UDPglucose 6-dehydrogenase